ncbi:MAG: hypothetical protein O3B13_11635 [Planctomycetota bacterium]|nr:hypothetical protein [Planctomycetota bacterium]
MTLTLQHYRTPEEPANRRASCLVLNVLALSLSIAGCTPPDGADDAVPPVPVAETADEETASIKDTNPDGSTHRHYEGIGFAIPNRWQELPNQTMVDSKYIIPTEHGEMEMTLTSMGGGLKSNLDRWVGQVGRDQGDEPTWATIEVAGIESRKVDVRGSFNSTVGANPGAKEDWRLVGIAVPLPRDFFIKLVGPREAVVEFQDELDEFLKSAHLDH